jgi:hypothetical protein
MLAIVRKLRVTVDYKGFSSVPIIDDQMLEPLESVEEFFRRRPLLLQVKVAKVQLAGLMISAL